MASLSVSISFNIIRRIMKSCALSTVVFRNRNLFFPVVNTFALANAKCFTKISSNRTFFLITQNLSFSLRRIKNFIILKSLPVTGIVPIVGIIAVCHQGQENKEPEITIQAPDPSTLTHSYLVKNACSMTVDAALAFFNQTVVALIDAETEYAKSLCTLISLLELSLETLGDVFQQDEVWELILKQRAEVTNKKKLNQEWQMLLTTVERLVNDVAEAAFLTGNEFISTTLNMHLHTAMTQVEITRKVSTDTEHQLNDVDIRSIKVTAEYAEKLAKTAANKNKSEEDSVRDIDDEEHG